MKLSDFKVYTYKAIYIPWHHNHLKKNSKLPRLIGQSRTKYAKYSWSQLLKHGHFIYETYLLFLIHLLILAQHTNWRY